MVAWVCGVAAARASPIHAGALPPSMIMSSIALVRVSFLGIFAVVSLFLVVPYSEAKKLSAMDVLARASMKDAAKCDTHCE